MKLRRSIFVFAPQLLSEPPFFPRPCWGLYAASAGLFSPPSYRHAFSAYRAFQRRASWRPFSSFSLASSLSLLLPIGSPSIVTAEFPTCYRAAESLQAMTRLDPPTNPKCRCGGVVRREFKLTTACEQLRTVAVQSQTRTRPTSEPVAIPNLTRLMPAAEPIWAELRRKGRCIIG